MASLASPPATDTSNLGRTVPNPSAPSAVDRNPVQEPTRSEAGHQPESAEQPAGPYHPGLLGSSLNRLYETGTERRPATGGQAGLGLTPAPSTVRHPPAASLTDSLLEAVFQISEFDPLPNVDQYQDFGAGLTHLSNRSGERWPGESAAAVLIPAPLGPIPNAPGVSADRAASNSSLDRRQLPRRESECVVAVVRCLPDERLTAERISWKLHAARFKGQLFDVSMSGIALYLPEPLEPGEKVLLRISNLTIDRYVDTAAIVLRCRPSVEGGCNVVCRFQKNLSFPQIHIVGRSLFASTIV